MKCVSHCIFFGGLCSNGKRYPRLLPWLALIQKHTTFDQMQRFSPFFVLISNVSFRFTADALPKWKLWLRFFVSLTLFLPFPLFFSQSDFCSKPQSSSNDFLPFSTDSNFESFYFSLSRSLPFPKDSIFILLWMLLAKLVAGECFNKYATQFWGSLLVWFPLYGHGQVISLHNAAIPLGFSSFCVLSENASYSWNVAVQLSIADQSENLFSRKLSCTGNVYFIFLILQ